MVMPSKLSSEFFYNISFFLRKWKSFNSSDVGSDSFWILFEKIPQPYLLKKKEKVTTY